MLDNKYPKRITIFSNLLQYFRFAGDPANGETCMEQGSTPVSVLVIRQFWHHHNTRFMLDQTGGRRQRRRRHLKPET